MFFVCRRVYFFSRSLRSICRRAPIKMWDTMVVAGPVWFQPPNIMLSARCCSSLWNTLTWIWPLAVPVRSSVSKISVRLDYGAVTCRPRLDRVHHFSARITTHQVSLRWNVRRIRHWERNLQIISTKCPPRSDRRRFHSISFKAFSIRNFSQIFFHRRNMGNHFLCGVIQKRTMWNKAPNWDTFRPEIPGISLFFF